jgi:hypothetical protein
MAAEHVNLNLNFLPARFNGSSAYYFYQPASHVRRRRIPVKTQLTS